MIWCRFEMQMADQYVSSFDRLWVVWCGFETRMSLISISPLAFPLIASKWSIDLKWECCWWYFCIFLASLTDPLLVCKYFHMYEGSLIIDPFISVPSTTFLLIGSRWSDLKWQQECDLWFINFCFAGGNDLMWIVKLDC